MHYLPNRTTRLNVLLVNMWSFVEQNFEKWIKYMDGQEYNVSPSWRKGDFI